MECMRHMILDPMRAVLAFAVVLVIAALAQDASSATRRVPQDYATVQAAIDASVDGDVVMIAPGTYRGAGNRNIETRGRAIVVTSSDGAEETIIDCEGAGRGFYIHEWESNDTDRGSYDHERHSGTRLRRRHLLRDRFALDPAVPHLQFAGPQRWGLGIIVLWRGRGRVRLQGNDTWESGGGVYVDYSGPVTLTNCLITGNSTAICGGGVSFQNGGEINVMRGCTVTANETNRDSGGVYGAGGVTFERCIIWDNCAPEFSEEFGSFNGATRFVCTDIDSSGVWSRFGTVEFEPELRILRSHVLRTGGLRPRRPPAIGGCHRTHRAQPVTAPAGCESACWTRDVDPPGYGAPAVPLTGRAACSAERSARNSKATTSATIRSASPTPACRLRSRSRPGDGSSRLSDPELTWPTHLRLLEVR